MTKLIMKSNVILLCLIMLLVTGCSNSTSTNNAVGNTQNSTTSDNKIKEIDDITKSSGILHCTRSGTANNAEPFFEYTLKYKDNLLLELHSIEGVTSDDEAVLDEYDTAYEKINANYKNLKYYDTEVIRTDVSVYRDTTINYAKIDTGKLLDIEGSENNIIENGQASLSAWLEFASKFGTTCTEE